MTGRAYADHRVGEYLDLVSAGTPAPGGGSVAAMTVSLAAALVAMAARCSSRQLAEHDQVAAEAEQLMRDAVAMADSDAEAYSAVIVARGAQAADGSATQGYEQAMQRAAEVPLAITAVAAQTAQLGARISRRGNPALAGDVATALQLAEAAARAAARLVQINVKSLQCDNDLGERAARNVEAARKALAAATVAAPDPCEPAEDGRTLGRPHGASYEIG